MAQLDNRTWVRELYRAILGRTPDPVGLDYWTNMIDAGFMTQWSAYQAFVASPEGQRELTARIRQSYRDVLGREADNEGLSWWLNQIYMGGLVPEKPSIDEMLRGSEEYQLRLGGGGPGRPGWTDTNPGPGSPPIVNPDVDTNPNIGGGGSGGLDLDFQIQNTRAQMQLILDRYGLGELSGWLSELITSPMFTGDMLMVELYGHEAFHARFPGMELRRGAGLNPITPEEYLHYETQAQAIMRAAGLPSGFYDDRSDFTTFIANNVSLSELGARVQEGWVRAARAPDAVRARFAQWFGVEGDAALAALFLDPDQAMPVLEQQLNQAEIAGTGDMMGFNFGRDMAIVLADLGHTGQSVQSGLRTVQQMDPLFQESVTEHTDFTAETTGTQAVFGLDRRAAQDLQRRAQSRTNVLSGGGGLLISEEGVGAGGDF